VLEKEAIMQVLEMRMKDEDGININEILAIFNEELTQTE